MLAQIALSAVAALTLAAPAEKVTLVKSVKEKTTLNYNFTADVSEEGQTMHFEGGAKLVLEPAKDGLTAEYSITDAKGTQGGMDMDPELPGPFRTKLDNNGFPEEMRVQDFEWVYTLLSICSFAPGETELGRTMLIVWKAKAGADSLKGEAKISEVKEVEGKKVMVLEGTFTVSPSSLPSGTVKFKSEIDAETGTLLKADGSLVADVEAKFTLRKK